MLNQNTMQSTKKSKNIITIAGLWKLTNYVLGNFCMVKSKESNSPYYDEPCNAYVDLVQLPQKIKETLTFNKKVPLSEWW